MPLSDRELADEIGLRTTRVVEDIKRISHLTQFLTEESDARIQLENVEATIVAALAREREAF